MLERSNRRWLQGAALVAAALVLAACQRKAPDDIPIAARVNGDAIGAHQVNLTMQQMQPGVRSDPGNVLTRRTVEGLIDRWLASQRALEMKLDSDPRVAQEIELRRREVLARAYVDKLGEGLPKPTADEIRKYYQDNPALFSQRRIYDFQEIAIEAKPEQVADLRSRLEGSKNFGEFLEYLKANDFKFAGNAVRRAAEQLPLNNLASLSRMQDGQAMVVPAANGMQVVLLVRSISQPVSEEQARTAIETFISTDRKRKAAEDEVKGLRGKAKLEYDNAVAPLPAASGAAAAASSGR